ncbi:aminoglycoside phosphotransferase family protein [Microbispora sp. NPDC088329]|uniref:aminoglycoside phosphotransferase family protein n=1 Tax=Microbispora sp. NPDC088329 TaxID=3154869 RepID=UPI0034372225
MTDVIVAALRGALATGSFARLRSFYAPEPVLESYVTGHRETTVGVDAIERSWARIAPGPGAETYFSVDVHPGGYDIDVQRTVRPTGRPERYLHRIGVVDGRVSRHIVYPSLPREPVRLLPEPVAKSLVAGSVGDLAHRGFSGATLMRARLASGEPVVIKHIRPGRDWLARASGDEGREGWLFVEGVYDRLPAQITTPVIDAVASDDGWVIVMRDVSRALDTVRHGDPVAGGRVLLAAVAEMHRAFRDTRPSAVLCSPADRLRLFSPLRPLIERRGRDMLPKTLNTAWESFADGAGDAIADAVLRLVADPAPLLSALAAEAPATLLHGDYRPDNLGVEGGRVVALDWGLACHGPAELDFVWFLSNTAWAGDEARAALETEWERVNGGHRAGLALDLAVIFHAVMGEVAFVMSEARHQPDGFPKPSAATVRWWLRRLEQAFERAGDLRGEG